MKHFIKQTEGASSSVLNNKVYIFDLTSRSWLPAMSLSSDTATARYNHIAQFHEPTSRLILFGGQTSFFAIINTVIVIQLTTLTTQNPSDLIPVKTFPLDSTPESRTQANSIIFKSNQGHDIIFIYGGVNTSISEQSAELVPLLYNDSYFALDLFTNTPASPSIVYFQSLQSYFQFGPPKPILKPTTTSNLPQTLTTSITAPSQELISAANTQVFKRETKSKRDSNNGILGPAGSSSNTPKNFAFINFNSSKSAYFYGGWNTGRGKGSGLWMMNYGIDGAFNWTLVNPAIPFSTQVQGISWRFNMSLNSTGQTYMMQEVIYLFLAVCTIIYDFIDLILILIFQYDDSADVSSGLVTYYPSNNSFIFEQSRPPTEYDLPIISNGSSCMYQTSFFLRIFHFLINTTSSTARCGSDVYVYVSTVGNTAYHYCEYNNRS
jgi:hypothetical protein